VFCGRALYPSRAGAIQKLRGAGSSRSLPGTWEALELIELVLGTHGPYDAYRVYLSGRRRELSLRR
jgi:hypothetical protein